MTVTRTVQAKWLDRHDAGFLGNKTAPIYGTVDVNRLAADLAQTIADLERDHYRILTVLPITSSIPRTHATEFVSHSFTSALIVVAQQE